MFKNLLNLLLVTAVLILFFEGCTRSSEDITQTPVKGRLKVALSDTYLPAGLIDSAYLIWPTVSGYDSATFRFEGNNLVLETGTLPQEPKNYQFAMVTSAKLGYHKLKWDKTVTTKFSPSSSITLQGPQSFQDTNWLPRVILNDHSGLIAFSGVRPTDAHFSFFNIDTLWNSIELERTYWNIRGGVHRVAGSVWHGVNVLDKKGLYSNDAFFAILPNQIGMQSWNHLEIFILFSNEGNTQMRGLSFTHDFY